MSFLSSLLAAAGQQFVSYLENEVEQAEMEEQQHSQPSPPASHPSHQRRISTPSHRLLSAPTPPTPPHPTALLSSPPHSLLSAPSSSSSSSCSLHSHPPLHCPAPATCTCTTAHSSPGDWTLTPLLVEFAAALSDHPATFVAFPACCPHAAAFHLTPPQLVHARRLLSACPAFRTLRAQVRDGLGVAELELWRVYFLLIANVRGRDREEGGRRSGRRVSGRAEERGRVDKENARPAMEMCQQPLEKGVSNVEQPKEDRYVEDAEQEEEVEGVGTQCFADESEQQRCERETALWTEVDRLMATLAFNRTLRSTTPPLATPSKAAHPAPAPDSSPASLNDSACSDYYPSPSPHRPPGLFDRLTADEQRSAADLLAPARQHSQQGAGGEDGDGEAREVSRLVFSPTPSWDGSMSGEEEEVWAGRGDADECDGLDSGSELDVSVCSVSSDVDTSSHLTSDVVAYCHL